MPNKEKVSGSNACTEVCISPDGLKAVVAVGTRVSTHSTHTFTAFASSLIVAEIFVMKLIILYY